MNRVWFPYRIVGKSGCRLAGNFTGFVLNSQATGIVKFRTSVNRILISSSNSLSIKAVSITAQVFWRPEACQMGTVDPGAPL